MVRRAARRPAPPLPSGDLAVPAPPAVPVAGGSRWTQLLIAVPMLTGTLATAMMFAGRQGGTYSYVVGGVFGVSSLGMLAASLGTGTGRQRRTDATAARRGYLRQLATLRERVRSTAHAQRTGLTYRHPAAADLWSLVDSHRTWERRPSDPDFGVVRIGCGTQTLATPLVPVAAATTEDLDPIAVAALRRFLDTHAVVPELPVALALPGFARVYLPDPDTGGRALLRALLASLSVFHSPDDLIIAACASPPRRADWEYLKWLPHARHPSLRDAIGPLRLVSDAMTDLESMLGPVLSRRSRFAPGRAEGRYVVVVLDGGDQRGSTLLAEGGMAGACVLELGATRPAGAPETAITLAVTAGGRLQTDQGTGPVDVGPAEALSATQAEALARQLAPLPTVGGSSDRAVPAAFDANLGTLLGFTDPAALDVARAWSGRPERRRLRVPIGVGPDGHAGRARPQGVRAGRHGPARAAHRRDRLRQVGAAAHARARAGRDARLGRAQLRAGRLQGRRHLRVAGPPAAHRRGDHQPGRRARRWSTG